MGDTAISWTDKTWNPVRGCSAVSPGCAHCYAEQQAARIVRMGKGKPTPYDGLVELVGKQQVPRWTGTVRIVPEHLADPLRWRAPKRVFVNSMSDLFHEGLTNEQIAAVFGVMAAAPQHTFQVLTKRARRMREWFEWVAEYGVEVTAVEAIARTPGRVEIERRLAVHAAWPLPNVWLGVSVENQDAADERIPELLRTPAAVRFLSCEPLLGNVLLDNGESSWLTCAGPRPTDDPEAGCCESQYVNGHHFHGIDWVIAGCESGQDARPCEAAWLRSLRNQCATAGVAFFLKQATECVETHSVYPSGRAAKRVEKIVAAGTGSKRKAGGVIELPYLDGVQHAAFPEVARV